MRFLLLCGTQSSTVLGDPNEAAPPIFGSAPVPLLSQARLPEVFLAHATQEPAGERRVEGKDRVG